MAKNIPLSQHVPEFEKAMDKALGEHLLKIQKDLAMAAPKDTGRFASSWFVAQDAPDRSVRPESWGTPAKRDSEGVIVKEGSKTVQIQPPSQRITYDGTWYVSNSLPYAERVSFDPPYAKGGAAGEDWFTSITNQIPAQWSKIVAKHLP